MNNIDDLLERQDELSSVIESQGDTPPPEQGSSLLSTLMKGLSIGPNAWGAAGVGLASDIKSAFGYDPEPGFESDTTWAERFKTSQDRNMGWSDIFRTAMPEIDFLPDNEFTNKKLILGKSLKDSEEGYEGAARTVYGLGADILTDPLSYLKYGGKAIKAVAGVGGDVANVTTKAAGKFLTEEGSNAFRTFADKVGVENIASYIDDPQMLESFNKLATGKSAREVSEEAFNILEKIKNPLGMEELSKINQLDVDKAIMSGESAAENMFKVARSADEAALKTERMKQAALDVTYDPLQVVPKEKQVRTALDLGEEVPIKSLFSKEALRFGGYEIPGTGEFIEGMNGGLYTTGVEGSRLLSQLGKKIKDVDSPILDKMTSAMNTLSKVPMNALSSVSRRIMGTGEVLGSRLPLTSTKEWQKAMLFNDNESMNRAKTLFSAFGPTEREAALNTFEESRKRFAVMQAKNPGLEMGAVEDMVYRELQQKDPKAHALFDFMKKDYDRMGKLEKESGITSNLIDDYLNRYYLSGTQHGDTRVALREFKAPKKNTGGKYVNDSFTLSRQFNLLDDAIANDFSPVRNLEVLYAQRVAGHNAMMSNKKFMDQMFFQHGLSEEARDQVARFARAEIEAGAKMAPEIIGRARLNAQALKLQIPEGVQLEAIGKNPKEILTGDIPESINHIIDKVDPIWGLPRNLSGIPISPSDYDNYQRIVQKEIPRLGDYLEQPKFDKMGEIISTGSKADIEKVIEKNKLTFAPEERQLVEELWDNYKTSNDKLAMLGRSGEYLTDRSGTSRLPSFLQSHVESALRNADEATKQFYRGDLPTPIINLINDSVDTRTWYQKMANSPDFKGTPYEKVLTTAGNVWNQGLSLVRAGSTKIWPSYLIGNLAQGQFAGLQAGMLLADNLALPNILANRQVFEKGADMITDFGQRLPNRQLVRDMEKNGIKMSYKDVSELTASWGKYFDAIGKYQPEDFLKGIADDPKDSPLVKRLARGFSEFTEGIENFGRQNLFVALKKKGYSSETAAEEVSRAFVDYQLGKTNFEKSALSNLFFFYSFARGSATNAVTSLFTQPGALSAQGSYIRFMTNLLKDEGAIQPEDFKKNTSTLKGTEGLTAYLGQDKETGNPRIISSFRTPLEETNRMAPIRLPSELSFAGIKDSVKENARNFTRAQLGSLNPFLKGTIEAATGRNLYFDKPLNDPYLNQVVKPSAVWDALKGTPQKDPTMFDPTGTIRTANMFLPPVSMLNSKLKQIATAKDPASGLLSVLTGIRTNIVEPEKSTAYEKIKRLEEYIIENYGVEVANKKPSTLIEDIGYSKEGLNPKRVRREQKAEKDIQKQEDRLERDLQNEKSKLVRSLDSILRQAKAEETSLLKAQKAEERIKVREESRLAQQEEKAKREEERAKKKKQQELQRIFK